MKPVSTISISGSVVAYPTLVKRVQAMAIDLLLILLVFTLSSVLISTAGITATGLKIAIFVACVLLYEPLLVALTGGTLGHKALGLRVKKYGHPDENIPIFSAIQRIIVKALLGWISFITVTSNREKRAMHDMLSGSIVLMK